MDNSAALTSPRKCWVPLCKQTLNNGTKLFPLPRNPECRDIWLALAGKSITLQNEPIYFCSEHFSVRFTVIFQLYSNLWN